MSYAPYNNLQLGALDTNSFNYGLPQVGQYAAAVPTQTADPAAGSAPGASGIMGMLSSLLSSAFDSKDGKGVTSQGWLSPVIGVAQGIGNAYMGMQQYGLAQDALKEQQRQFNLNYQAQRKMTNSTLEDRQRARIASNPTAYQSVGEYMKQYGV